MKITYHHPAKVDQVEMHVENNTGDIIIRRISTIGRTVGNRLPDEAWGYSLFDEIRDLILSTSAVEEPLPPEEEATEPLGLTLDFDCDCSSCNYKEGCDCDECDGCRGYLTIQCYNCEHPKVPKKVYLQGMDEWELLTEYKRRKELFETGWAADKQAAVNAAKDRDGS